MLKLEDLAELLERHRNEADARVAEFSIGAKHFAFNSAPAIMGVINLSPDSWYRESVCLTAEAAVRRARVLAAQGADIIDLGAESTLAHAALASEKVQKTKLLPILEELRRVGLLISVETYGPAVARTSRELTAARRCSGWWQRTTRR